MSPRLKTIQTLGAHGSRVRVFIQGDLVRVRWRVNGVRKHQSWANTPENRATAKAFAVGIAEARKHPGDRPKLRLTLRELWDRYQEAEFPSLRPKSQERYLERWRKWERFLGRDFIAEATTQENVDQYRTARAEYGIVVNQIAEEVKLAKTVYAWGQRRRLLGQNDLALYRFKVAKEDRRESPAEYRMDDFTRILERLNPGEWGQWRPWGLLTLLGYQGVRTNAARHLQWADVDLEAGVLTWRAKYDKIGKEWHQPLRSPTRQALALAWAWRERQQYHGPWVWFSEDKRHGAKGNEPVYTHQALAYQLTQAEERAKVPHLDLRAMHGLRRMVVGEIVRLTGDIAAAAQFIGDTDLRVVNRSYLKRRDDQLRAVAERLDVAHAPTRKSNESALQSVVAGAKLLNQREPLVGFEPTTAPLSEPAPSSTSPVNPQDGTQDLAPNDPHLDAETHPETATKRHSGGAR